MNVNALGSVGDEKKDLGRKSLLSRRTNFYEVLTVKKLPQMIIQTEGRVNASEEIFKRMK